MAQSLGKSGSWFWVFIEFWIDVLIIIMKSFDYLMQYGMSYVIFQITNGTLYDRDFIINSLRSLARVPFQVVAVSICYVFVL